MPTFNVHAFHQVPTLFPGPYPPFDIDAPVVEYRPQLVQDDTVDRVYAKLRMAFHEGILAWWSAVETLTFMWVALGPGAYGTRGYYRYATAAEVAAMCRTLEVHAAVIKMFTAVCTMYGFDAFAVPMHDDGTVSFAFPLAAAASAGFAGLSIGRLFDDEGSGHGTNARFTGTIGNAVMIAHVALGELVTRWTWPEPLAVKAAFPLRSVLLPGTSVGATLPVTSCRGGFWYIGVGRVTDVETLRVFLRHVTSGKPRYEPHVVDFDGCIQGAAVDHAEAAFTVLLCWLPTAPRPPAYILMDNVALQPRHTLILLATAFMLGGRTFASTAFTVRPPLDPNGCGTLLRLFDRWQRNAAALGAYGVRGRDHVLPRLSHPSQLLGELNRWRPTLVRLADRMLAMHPQLFAHG